jgi:hypothetical protein
MKFTYGSSSQTVTIGAPETGTIKFDTNDVAYVQDGATTYDDVTQAEGETDEDVIIVTFLPYPGNTLDYDLDSGPSNEISFAPAGRGGFSATCEVPASGSTEWVVNVIPQTGAGTVQIGLKSKRET